MMTIYKWLLVSLIISVEIMLFIDLFVFIRINVVYRNRCKIIDAIHDYGIYLLIDKDDQEAFIKTKLIYDKMESYNKTMIRFWDFGYKRILPKQEFDKIKDFIK